MIWRHPNSKRTDTLFPYTTLFRSAIDGVIVTGGTGFTGRDSTPEALLPLLDKTMPGFGEMFRQLSYDEIGTSTMQSRAFAGLANATFVRSEEHTSELQSLMRISYAVFCLKKKKYKEYTQYTT